MRAVLTLESLSSPGLHFRTAATEICGTGVVPHRGVPSLVQSAAAASPEPKRRSVCRRFRSRLSNSQSRLVS